LLCGLPNSPEKTVVTEHFNTCLKKGRGLGKASLALDPNDLRSCVEEKIVEQIEPAAWNPCKVTEAAEKESLVEVMTAWRRP
jgi:hypothetical protein